MAYLPASRALPGAANPKSRRRGVMAYFDLFRQRRALARLDAHLLRDVGLTKEEAQREAERPIWDAPRHWL